MISHINIQWGRLLNNLIGSIDSIDLIEIHSGEKSNIFELDDCLTIKIVRLFLATLIHWSRF